MLSLCWARFAGGFCECNSSVHLLFFMFCPKNYLYFLRFISRMVVISSCMKAQGTVEPASGHLSPLGQNASLPCLIILSLQQEKQNLWTRLLGHWTKWVSSSFPAQLVHLRIWALSLLSLLVFASLCPLLELDTWSGLDWLLGWPFDCGRFPAGTLPPLFLSFWCCFCGLASLPCPPGCVIPLCTGPLDELPWLLVPPLELPPAELFDPVLLNGVDTEA